MTTENKRTPSKATLATSAFRKVQTCKEAIEKHKAAIERYAAKAAVRTDVLAQNLTDAEAELERVKL